MNKLQLGIDIGRVLANTQHGHTADDMRAAAQKILDAAELGFTVDEEPSFLLGLGWGCSDRHQTPIETEAQEVIGIPIE